MCLFDFMDQEQFYSGYKQNHGYKFQFIVIPNGLVSSLMRPFIKRWGDWKMVEVSSLVEKLRAVNGGRQPAHALYLYRDQAYCTVYDIMGPLKPILEDLKPLFKRNSPKRCQNYKSKWNTALLFIIISELGLDFSSAKKFDREQQLDIQFQSFI